MKTNDALEKSVTNDAWATKSDLQVAASLKKALGRNTAVTEDKIHVKLDNGWVYIRIQP